MIYEAEQNKRKLIEDGDFSQNQFARKPHLGRSLSAAALLLPRNFNHSSVVRLARRENRNGRNVQDEKSTFS